MSPIAAFSSSFRVQGATFTRGFKKNYFVGWLAEVAAKNLRKAGRGGVASGFKEKPACSKAFWWMTSTNCLNSFYHTKKMFKK